MSHSKGNQKHLTLSQRIEIEKGRSYDDFQKMLKKKPSTAVVEMATVEGVKGGEVYIQDDITLMINHINREARDSLNGCTPYQLSQFLLNNQLHTNLLLQVIEPDEVTLRPELLK